MPRRKSHGRNASRAADGEVRCCIELLGKLSGEISSSVNFNVINITEARFTEFMDAIEKKGDLTVAHMRQLVACRSEFVTTDTAGCVGVLPLDRACVG